MPISAKQLSGPGWVLGAVLLASTAASAHFQELIPSTDIVPDEGDHTVSLSIVFTHPVERGPTRPQTNTAAASSQSDHVVGAPVSDIHVSSPGALGLRSGRGSPRPAQSNKPR